MNTLIAWTANYLLWVMVAGAGAVWLFREDRDGRIRLAAAGVIALVLALGLIFVAAHLHNDPRPFVVNPKLHPLISHSADNGFPSDHATAGGLIAALVWFRHRRLGMLFGIGAVLLAAARVAAHVHHVQDVVAGLAFGAIAAAVATLAVDYALSRRRQPAAMRQ
jgi:membrane-associated phospholipid phosphatase